MYHAEAIVAYTIKKFQADKALQGAGSGFSFFGGRSEKYENAADLYTQAGMDILQLAGFTFVLARAGRTMKN